MIKPLIGFLLKKLPRTLLQRISKPIFKIISIFYNGDNVNCPICKKSAVDLTGYWKLIDQVLDRLDQLNLTYYLHNQLNYREIQL